MPELKAGRRRFQERHGKGVHQETIAGLFLFFQTSQFKCSAVPNGPQVGSGGSLSPRGDWRAPSDSEAMVWLKELQENVPD